MNRRVFSSLEAEEIASPGAIRPHVPASALTTTPRPGADFARALVERMQRQEPGAVDTLVLTYRGAIRSVLRRCGLRPCDIDDVLQDTWLVAIDKIEAGELRDPARLCAFLRGIACWHAANQRRKEDRRATSFGTEQVEAFASELDGPEQALMREANRQLVIEVLKQLPRGRDRDVLELFVLQGKDKDEVCIRLGIKSERFHGVLCRAKQRCRKLLNARAINRDGPQ